MHRMATVHVSKDQGRTRFPGVVGEAAVHHPGMKDVEMARRSDEGHGLTGVQGILGAAEAMEAFLPLAQQTAMGSGQERDST